MASPGRRRRCGAPQNQADYLLIAPRAFLAAARASPRAPQDQGLTARAVAFEEIAEAFGHGQPSAEAIRSFLAFAFHSWARPSPRYVLLARRLELRPAPLHRHARGPSPLPALWARDVLPLDRLRPAARRRQRRRRAARPRDRTAPGHDRRRRREMLVDKLLAWEDSGQGLAGPAALVADNPDAAGDFEADAQDIAASFLAGPQPEVLRLGELGAETRPAILRRPRLRPLVPELRRPRRRGRLGERERAGTPGTPRASRRRAAAAAALTLNCLNGYFVAPGFDSLAESLAQGRGTRRRSRPSRRAASRSTAPRTSSTARSWPRSRAAATRGSATPSSPPRQPTPRPGSCPSSSRVYHLFGDPATPAGRGGAQPP